MNIVIVDYGMGNSGSILNMLRYLGIEAMISGDPADIRNASKIILPGVGAFDAGMTNLKASGWYQCLRDRVLTDRIPILGICLGMQLMTLRSEEGTQAGLGWIRAVTRRFHTDPNPSLKVPHIGWNRIHTVREHPIAAHLDALSKFYFVHSYYVACEDSEDCISQTPYGVTFDSIFAKDNLVGCQFHPEKSHKHGMQIFKNFHNL